MDAEKEHANKALFMFFASFLERLYFFQMFLLYLISQRHPIREDKDASICAIPDGKGWHLVIFRAVGVRICADRYLFSSHTLSEGWRSLSLIFFTF